MRHLQEEKAEGAASRRKLQAALVEVAATATTKLSSSEVRDLLAEAKEAAAADEEKEGGGEGEGEGGCQIGQISPGPCSTL